MSERFSERQLPLPQETFLSKEPHVEIIAITRNPRSPRNGERMAATFNKLQQALEEGSLEEARKVASEYARLIVSNQGLDQIGSSLTVLAGESALTCYSSGGLRRPEDYLKKPANANLTDRVITSTRKSGHSTTRQHGYVTFGLDNVSRAVLWDFFHPHPFYGSDQVSQRYVEVKPGNFVVPPVEDESLDIYLETARKQMEAYQQLLTILRPDVQKAYFDLSESRRTFVIDHPEDSRAKAVQRRIDSSTQEIARYVLPVATFAYLYHTVNTLTLCRYQRASQMIGLPTEQQIIVTKMVNSVLKQDPKFFEEVDDPLALEETPEFQALEQLRRTEVDFATAECFVRNFDKRLEGRASKLIGSFANSEELLADAVRTVLGTTGENLSDNEAVNLLLNPSRNRTLGEPLNLSTVSKLGRAMEMVSFTFQKKLSHTADSQDQRHRMVPGARPVLATQYSGRPDFIIPPLIQQNPEVLAVYEGVMRETFTAINKLLERGVKPEFALYLLPNAFPVRFTETGTLLNLRHKAAMRLCFNAQEEIWKAMREEVEEISRVSPVIGRYLLPPCGSRFLAKTKPTCPEGERYCGQTVWQSEPENYRRII